MVASYVSHDIPCNPQRRESFVCLRIFGLCAPLLSLGSLQQGCLDWVRECPHFGLQACGHRSNLIALKPLTKAKWGLLSLKFKWHTAYRAIKQIKANPDNIFDSNFLELDGWCKFCAIAWFQFEVTKENGKKQHLDTFGWIWGQFRGVANHGRSTTLFGRSTPLFGRTTVVPRSYHGTPHTPHTHNHIFSIQWLAMNVKLNQFGQ